MIVGYRISIHTTTQVVTDELPETMQCRFISIHTTTQVVTMPFQWSPGPAEISIHTTTQVVTRIQCGPYLYMRISIHTTTQVVTGGGDHKGCQAVYFNPHHHAGGDTYIQRMDGGTAISIHTTTQVVTEFRFMGSG